MHLLRSTLLCLLPLAVFSACSTSEEAVFSSGSYAYRAFDGQGQEVASGTLDLLANVPAITASLTGQWTAEAGGTFSDPTGAYRLSGYLDGGTVSLEFVTGVADGGLGANLEVQGSRHLVGTWGIGTIAGPVEMGRFEARCSQNCQPLN